MLFRSGKGKRALFGGLAAGAGLALLLGWALLSVQDELTGEALECPLWSWSSVVAPVE